MLVLYGSGHLQAPCKRKYVARVHICPDPCTHLGCDSQRLSKAQAQAGGQAVKGACSHSNQTRLLEGNFVLNPKLREHVRKGPCRVSGHGP